MSSILKNLSNYNPETLPKMEILGEQRYAIAVSDWNNEVTFALLEGALETFIKYGVQEANIDVVHVPGTFELTYVSSLLQKSYEYVAIVAIGCVIKGDTPHFDYICQGVTYGITQLNLHTSSCPVIFSVLTTNNLQQALDRSGGKHGNKGTEGALTAMRMANLLNKKEVN
jgi:6,7-dimethyl-8-ribityllumazine synthase